MEACGAFEPGPNPGRGPKAFSSKEEKPWEKNLLLRKRIDYKEKCKFPKRKKPESRINRKSTFYRMPCFKPDKPFNNGKTSLADYTGRIKRAGT